MEKIIITGGAGFIGSNTTNALLKRHKVVICIDNFDPYYSTAIKNKNISDFLKRSIYKLYREDIRNIRGLERIFIKEKPDKIIHLAAKVGVRNSLLYPKEYEEVNVGGTLNLLELARKYKIKQFIFGSTSSVYGNNSKIPFSEKDPAGFPVSPYAATKKAAEILCKTYSYLYKIPITCLRFFTVYGPSGRPDMAPYKFTKAIYEGKPVTKYGTGTSKRDYTYIDDIVDGIISTLRKKFPYEIVNLGGADMINLNDFILLIETLLGKKAKIDSLPNQTADAYTTYADISKAGRLFHYKPKYSVKMGMGKFIIWYLNEIKSIEKPDKTV